MKTKHGSLQKLTSPHVAKASFLKRACYHLPQDTATSHKDLGKLIGMIKYHQRTIKEFKLFRWREVSLVRKASLSFSNIMTQLYKHWLFLGVTAIRSDKNLMLLWWSILWPFLDNTRLRGGNTIDKILIMIRYRWWIKSWVMLYCLVFYSSKTI